MIALLEGFQKSSTSEILARDFYLGACSSEFLERLYLAGLVEDMVGWSDILANMTSYIRVVTSYTHPSFMQMHI